LYNYVDKDLIDIGKIDLPEKTKRSHKRERIRKNRKKLGDSIEERPKTVESREKFGNWEIDSVLGKKGEKEPVIVTIVERKTRKCIWLKARDHTADALMEVIEKAFKPYLERINEIFKTITADNGSEFSRLSELKSKGIGIYFTHPFSSFEKGTNECHNRMLRRFIPKGKSMLDYSQEDINYFVKIIDRLPRKILDYQTPEELFERELKNIYASR
jgi:IS30 family transposase